MKRLGSGEAGKPRPFDFDSLLCHARLNMMDASRSLDVVRVQLYRWRRYGLTVDQADDLAASLGYHPSEIWPDWYLYAAEPITRHRIRAVVAP